MTGDQKALNYFSVDSQTCFVRVNRLLTEDTTRDIRYTVSIYPHYRAGKKANNSRRDNTTYTGSK